MPFPLLNPDAIVRALREGKLVVDRVFDEIFPPEVRAVSNVFWTPVAVAARASSLLVRRPEATILDIGAGVGKFCLVAAALDLGASVRGVEHRPRLVEIARGAAATLGVEIDLSVGTIADHDPAAVHGIYLFNPFGENLSPARERLDDSVPLGLDRYLEDLELTHRFLKETRPGTRVVTYCGWGGAMPSDYEMVSRELIGGPIELWIKRSRSAAQRGP